MKSLSIPNTSSWVKDRKTVCLDSLRCQGSRGILQSQRQSRLRDISVIASIAQAPGNVHATACSPQLAIARVGCRMQQVPRSVVGRAARHGEDMAGKMGDIELEMKNVSNQRQARLRDAGVIGKPQQRACEIKDGLPKDPRSAVGRAARHSESMEVTQSEFIELEAEKRQRSESSMMSRLAALPRWVRHPAEPTTSSIKRCRRHRMQPAPRYACREMRDRAGDEQTSAQKIVDKKKQQTKGKSRRSPNSTELEKKERQHEEGEKQRGHAQTELEIK
ncbi:hypothetical protein C8F01DRAFT_1091748 [Mycena amicta]|nr:hypothetical protein C8F01DRAFT_1091748 [Mycena amicta]